MKVDNSACGVR